MKNKVLEFVDKFLKSKMFIVFIMILTFFLYIGNLVEVSCILVPLFIILYLVRDKKSVPMMSIFFLWNASYDHVKGTNFLSPSFIIAYILYFFVALLLVKDIIKYRYLYLERIKKNYILYAMGIMMLVMFISLINTPDITYSALGIADYFLIIVMFIVSLMVIDSSPESRNNLVFLMIMAGILTSFEMLYRMIDLVSGKFTMHQIMSGKYLSLGWIHTNHGAALINISLILSVYLFTTTDKIKYKVFTSAASLLFIFMEIILKCRGGYAGMLVIIPILLGYYFIYKNKFNKNYFCDIICFVVVLLIFITIFIIFYKFGYVKDIKEAIIKRGLDETGRFKLWRIAFKQFKNHFIIGPGVFTSRYYIEKELGWKLFNYHNAFMQVLGCLGILGFIAFVGYLVVIVLKCFARNPYNILLLIILGYMLIHGMVDTIFFNRQIEPIMLMLISPVLIKKEEAL